MMYNETFIELKRLRAGESEKKVHSKDSKHLSVVKIGSQQSLQNPQLVSKVQQILQSDCPVLKYRQYQIYCQAPYCQEKHSLHFRIRCKHQQSCRQTQNIRLGATMKLHFGEERKKHLVKAVAFIREGSQNHLEQPVDTMGFKNIIKKTIDGTEMTAKLFLKPLFNIIESQLGDTDEMPESKVTPAQKRNFLRNGFLKIEFVQQILDQINKTEELAGAQDLRDLLLQRLDELSRPLIDEKEKLPGRLLFDCFAGNFSTFHGFSADEQKMHTWPKIANRYQFDIIEKNEHYQKSGFGELKQAIAFDEEWFLDFLIFDYPVITSLIQLLPKVLRNGLLDHNISHWLTTNQIRQSKQKEEKVDKQHYEMELRQAKAMQKYDRDRQTLEFNNKVDEAIIDFVLRGKPVANVEIQATKLFEDSQTEVQDCEKELELLKVEQQKLEHNIKLKEQELQKKREAARKHFTSMLHFQTIHKIAKVAQQAEQVEDNDLKEQFDAELEANTKELDQNETKLLGVLMTTPKPKEEQIFANQSEKNQEQSSGSQPAKMQTSNITSLDASDPSTQPTSPPANKFSDKLSSKEPQVKQEREKQQKLVTKKLNNLKNVMTGVQIKSRVNGQVV